MPLKFDVTRVPPTNEVTNNTEPGLKTGISWHIIRSKK